MYKSQTIKFLLNSNCPMILLMFGLPLGSRSKHCLITATMAGWCTCCSRASQDQETFDCISQVVGYHSCRHPSLVTVEWECWLLGKHRWGCWGQLSSAAGGNLLSHSLRLWPSNYCWVQVPTEHWHCSHLSELWGQDASGGGS